MATTVEKVSRVKQHTVYKKRDGKRVPGVTTVLGVIAKPALKFWANSLGLQGIEVRTYVDKLAEIGTLAHLWIMSFLAGEDEPDFSETWSKEQIDLASNSVIKFLDWHKEHGGREKIKVIGLEMPMVSEKGYGGTLDILAEVDGSLGIIDIKTSKAIYDDHLYQVAAYRSLASVNGYKVDWVRILQVGRTEDEGFTEKHITLVEVVKYWDVFAAALTLYEAMKVSRRKS